MAIHLGWRERSRACVGALIGIALTAILSSLLLGSSAAWPMLIAPMGASAVLLFAVPSSPLAQPWSVLCGNTVAALVGVSCATWLGHSLPFAAALAVAVSIGLMFVLRCVHPPSGAIALTAVLGGPDIHALGFAFVLTPVAVNSLLLLVLAIIFHRSTGYRYPHAPRVERAAAAVAAASRERLGFTRADLDAVLESREELLDVDVDDLDAILHAAEMRAYGRRFGHLSAEQIMTRDVRTVPPELAADAAWSILLKHRIKALPVIDAERRVVGIVTQTDFVRHANISTFADLKRRGRIIFAGDKNQDELTVRDVMTTKVRTVGLDRPIAELVPAFTDAGHHHLPVVDAEHRLHGMVTQADLVAGLYSARMAQTREGS